MRRRFRSGFGRVTAAMFTDAVAAGSRDREMGPLLGEVAADYNRTPPLPEYVLAEITGHTALAGASNRWEYTWQEKRIDGALELVDGFMTDELMFPALNLCEMVNDGLDVEGPGWNVTTAPNAFSIQPIQKCVVMMYPYTLEDATQRMIFSMANVLDGECP